MRTSAVNWAELPLEWKYHTLPLSLPPEALPHQRMYLLCPRLEHLVAEEVVEEEGDNCDCQKHVFMLLVASSIAKPIYFERVAEWRYCCLKIIFLGGLQVFSSLLA